MRREELNMLNLSLQDIHEHQTWKSPDLIWEAPSLDHCEVTKRFEKFLSFPNHYEQ